MSSSDSKTKTTQLATVSEKEKRLSEALSKLSDKELAQWKFFRKSNQNEISPDICDQMFRLFQRGSSCDEIRRIFGSYSISQIVAARVMHDWDVRKDIEVENIKVEVPAKTEVTQLEMQEFLANILTASHRKFNDALKLYIATGDATHLDKAGVPMPKNTRELKEIVEMYMKVAGIDSKKVEVKHSGGVVHEVKQVRSSEEAESIMDELLGEDPVDAEFVEAPKEEPKAIAPMSAERPDEISPKDTVEFLVNSGMPREKAVRIAGLKDEDDPSGQED